MNREQVRGLVLDLGSRTSHTAIMAQSLGIPAVVGLHDATETLETGAPALIDGYHGLLIVHPSEETLREYAEIERQKGAIAERLTQLRETKSTTRDGCHIVLSANIELPDEVDAVLANGAEGIGLLPHGISLPQSNGAARRKKSNSKSTELSLNGLRQIR